MDLIQTIQSEMLGYGFNLSVSYINTWLKIVDIESFDTLERGDLLQYIAQKEVGMDYPINGNSESYKKEFWLKMSNRPL